MGKQKELTHDEVWDDSGLIQSWNDSYEEYKHYHSIQARGERVKDVLVAAKATVGDGSSAKHETTGNEVASSNASLDEGEVEEEDPSFDPAMETLNAATQNQYGNGSAEAASTGESMPRTVIAHSSQDQGLKNLMMSWYWAGYYTGLYEGQRQAAGSTEAPAKGNA